MMKIIISATVRKTTFHYSFFTVHYINRYSIYKRPSTFIRMKKPFSKHFILAIVQLLFFYFVEETPLQAQVQIFSGTPAPTTSPYGSYQQPRNYTSPSYGGNSSYYGGNGIPFFRNVQMGFRVAPTLSITYADGDGKFSGITDNGISLQMSVGPTADFFFGDKYAFSTGLFYTVKQAGFRVPDTFLNEVKASSGGAITSTASLSKTSIANIQYLQVPLSFKLYSNSLINSSKVYIQFGCIADLKIAEKPLDRAVSPIYLYTKYASGRSTAFNIGDFGLLLAFGGEYSLGSADSVYMGLFYNRGLTSIMREDDLISKLSIVGIEMGLKF
jgi:Outer membrane protein beta-barrel domain